MGWANINLNLGIWDENSIGAEILGLFAFIVLLSYFIWEIMQAKKEE